MEAVEETTEPSVAELKEYIEQLKRHVELLQEENRSLFEEVQDYRRREFHLIMRRP